MSCMYVCVRVRACVCACVCVCVCACVFVHARVSATLMTPVASATYKTSDIVGDDDSNDTALASLGSKRTKERRRGPMSKIRTIIFISRHHSKLLFLILYKIETFPIPSFFFLRPRTVDLSISSPLPSF